MALNVKKARIYNSSRGYRFEAKRAIRRQLGMSSSSGSFDNTTIRAIYDWQGSPDRITALTKDGMFGPNSLGCMLSEMRRGSVTTDIAALNRYPHTKPSPSGTGASAVIKTFSHTDLVHVDLRNGKHGGWKMKGRFRVDIQFNPSLANPNRYQYRQFIKGYVRATPGRFRSANHSISNWEATSASEDLSHRVKVPGGLSATSWREDGIDDGGARYYGYRSAPGFVITGEEDRYFPDQKNGSRYVCMDTYGVEGSGLVSGMKIELDLSYRFVVVDILNTRREVARKSKRYSAMRIMT